MSNFFSIILTIITLFTSIFWIINLPKLKLFFIKKNKKKANQFFLKNIYQNKCIKNLASFFPIFFTVLIIRSFIYEPFQIPSVSMLPNLLVGDFILVEKFSYGLKDPIMNKTFLKTNTPKRGEIAVFKYPKNTKINFIKRIIGLPGDKIIYNSQKNILSIYPNYLKNKNRKKIPIFYSPEQESEWVILFKIDQQLEPKNQSKLFSKKKELPKNTIRQNIKYEKIKDVKYNILTIPKININLFDQNQTSKEWIVPKKNYFVMGDNRDNSLDSRIWGFVPEENLIGKATIIWFSLKKNENEWPSGIRFNRIGFIK